METEPTETPAPEQEDHTDMTVVMIGERAVWITIWDYYAHYNT